MEKMTRRKALSSAETTEHVRSYIQTLIKQEMKNERVFQAQAPPLGINKCQRKYPSPRGGVLITMVVWVVRRSNHSHLHVPSPKNQERRGIESTPFKVLVEKLGHQLALDQANTGQNTAKKQYR